jgi:hypothetical protein
LHELAKNLRLPTAMHIPSALKSYIRIIDLLVQSGADATAQSRKGKSPIDLARLGRNVHFIRAVEQRLAVYTGWLSWGEDSLGQLLPTMGNLLKSYSQKWCVVVPVSKQVLTPQGIVQHRWLEMALYPAIQAAVPTCVLNLRGAELVQNGAQQEERGTFKSMLKKAVGVERPFSFGIKIGGTAYTTRAGRGFLWTTHHFAAQNAAEYGVSVEFFRSAGVYPPTGQARPQATYQEAAAVPQPPPFANPPPFAPQAYGEASYGQQPPFAQPLFDPLQQQREGGSSNSNNSSNNSSNDNHNNNSNIGVGVRASWERSSGGRQRRRRRRRRRRRGS